MPSTPSISRETTDFFSRVTPIGCSCTEVTNDAVGCLLIVIIRAETFGNIPNELASHLAGNVVWREGMKAMIEVERAGYLWRINLFNQPKDA